MGGGGTTGSTLTGIAAAEGALGVKSAVTPHFAAEAPPPAAISAYELGRQGLAALGGMARKPGARRRRRRGWANRGQSLGRAPDRPSA